MPALKKMQMPNWDNTIIKIEGLQKRLKEHMPEHPLLYMVAVGISASDGCFMNHNDEFEKEYISKERIIPRAYERYISDLENALKDYRN